MNRSVLLSIGLIAWPVLAPAQTAPATPTPEAIRACEANRTGPGCATLRNRIFVCAQASAIQGCEALLALRETALADPEDLPDDEIEPDVTPRAEGELADDPSADEASGVSDDGDTASDDAASVDPAQDDATDPADCPMADSADWRAVVGPVDGAEGPHLIVTGRITLPTPAWTATLAAGMADRSARPVQRVNLTLARPAPGLSVIQVLTDYDLRLETPAIGVAPPGESPYRGVMVLCGGMVLVDLAEVGLAD